MNLGQYTILKYNRICTVTEKQTGAGYRNKWSKNFDKRPHRRFVTPRGGECIRPTLIPI